MDFISLAKGWITTAAAPPCNDAEDLRSKQPRVAAVIANVVKQSSKVLISCDYVKNVLHCHDWRINSWQRDKEMKIV